MTEKVVLVTGSLANKEMDIVVSNLGVKVADLMTTDIVERRLTPPDGTDRVIMPGQFRDNQRAAARIAASANSSGEMPL